MSGPLSSSIGLFSELTTLALSNNALGGTIPIELTNLKKAYKVLLASTNLTGTLPSTIGTMMALTQLDIAGNNL
jgi:Leucine-rich repeat (LRR) protein